MTVYVDDMYLYEMGRFRRMKMSHMIADIEDELHAMADKIGLARKWYQGDHYDVSMSLRRKAIEQGAVAITWRELGRMTLERRRTMGRKPGSGNKKSQKAISGLLTALRFIEPAQAEAGQVNQTHCMFHNKWVAAFNGIIMMAAKVDTDITACPNTKRLIATLSKCDESVQITQLDSGRLGIKSGKFSAFVPCVEPGLLAFTGPDAPQADWNDTIGKALATVGIVAKENAPRMVQASILLRANSALATDGVMIFEAWHGVNMPTVVLPKVFVAELGKIGKKAVKCGASLNSFTVYFEDESFIKTQLYVEPYPDVDRILNGPSSQYAIPAEFFGALEKLSSMAGDNKSIYFNAKGSKLQTADSDQEGASFDIDYPLPDGIVFNIELLSRFAPFAKTVDWVAGSDGNMAMFYGDAFRGCLMQKDPGKAKFADSLRDPAPQPEARQTEGGTTFGQMIPQAGGMPPGGHGSYQAGNQGLEDEIPF